MMKRRVQTIFVLALCLFSVTSCGDQEQISTGPKLGKMPVKQQVGQNYHFAVHPLHNPTKLIEAYQPLIDYLNRQIASGRFTLEASRDYASFEEKYRARLPEFLLPNPWQTLQAEAVGYHVLAMAGDPNDFKGIFLVRKDSGIVQPADLIGKAISYPSPTALAACIMPQFFLHNHSLNVLRDLDNRYVGSQESSIMNVYMKQTAAGVTWPPPWRAFQKEHPREAGELKILWETEPLINNSVMARDDIPAAVREQVRTILVGMNNTVEGEAILAGMETARFLSASNEDYEVVRRYVARFENEVRPVEKK